MPTKRSKPKAPRGSAKPAKSVPPNPAPDGPDSGGGRRSGTTHLRILYDPHKDLDPHNPQPHSPTSTLTSRREMPGLTLNTSSPTPSSRSLSPTRPPYSPITPTNSLPSDPPLQSRAPQPIYIHTSQSAQVGIPQPPPVKVDFENNPDVMAIKATMAVLLMQEKNAERDMRVLSEMKGRAVGDPGEFMNALVKGEIKNAEDPLLNPGSALENDDEEDEDADEDEDEMEGVKMEGEDKGKAKGGTPKKGKPWPKFPAHQNVARCPPVNWSQYGVVGDSLEKLHKEQVARPSEGSPGRLGVDGNYTFAAGPVDGGGGGVAKVAAPYMPGKDVLEKKGRGKGKGKK